MIYFDNAATTFPKPPLVINALKKAVGEYGGIPGRAGHNLSIKTAEAVFEARAKCAELFGAQVEHTIFTLNCTHALNMAIKGISAPGAHYIMSDLEHNASARPIHAVSKSGGITYSVAKTFDDDDQTVKSFESLISTKTKAVVCTAASNVTGKILPFSRIAKLCQKRGVCFILDAAQGAVFLNTYVKKPHPKTSNERIFPAHVPQFFALYRLFL
jgi:selenocysteine lyase/cysteine desulfurase